MGLFGLWRGGLPTTHYLANPPNVFVSLVPRSINWVMKGQNLLTEMYSAMKADVEVESDESTKFNQVFFDELQNSEKLLVCGQAMSHCVNFTVRDIVGKWDEVRLGDLVLLTDCASSVPGFEESGSKFLKEMSEKGVTCVGSLEIESCVAGLVGVAPTPTAQSLPLI